MFTDSEKSFAACMQQHAFVRGFFFVSVFAVCVVLMASPFSDSLDIFFKIPVDTRVIQCWNSNAVVYVSTSLQWRLGAGECAVRFVPRLKPLRGEGGGNI
jgi:hypothetical protein